MTLKMTRGLWLWGAILALALLAIFPLAIGTQLTAALAVTGLAALVWVRAGRHEAQLGAALVFARGASLPLAAYRQPVVLVCGDGLPALFGPIPSDQLALRVTPQGCYVRVPVLEQLPVIAAGLMAVRAHWGPQLGVMLVTNPGEHTDDAVLAGRIRAFDHQVTVVRRRGLALPLLWVSYVQSSGGTGPWFSWEANRASPNVREAGACIDMADWQRQAPGAVALGARLHACVQLTRAAAWSREAVLPFLAAQEGRHPVASAITFVPALPQVLADNLWQQWLLDKVALIDTQPAGSATSLPFPDPLLNLLPMDTRWRPAQRATARGVWLFAAAALIALASSAWQNSMLIRQVSDHLHRYTSIAVVQQPDRPEFALREEAVAVLRQDARQLNLYHLYGEPLALGFGLYRGEPLRFRVLAAIAGHLPPLAAPIPAGTSSTVRLDSLSLFSSGSAELKAESTKVLISALAEIKAQPGWLIVVAGHTDATGNADHNLHLSRARAGAVHDWMRRMGDIPDSCFAVQGFGASQPIASNDTETGRMANRRVDIRLVPEAGACVLPATTPGRQPPAASSGI